jgi:hypothetical protein
MKMNCQEFQLYGLDPDGSREDRAVTAAAAEHARLCPSCYALLQSWLEVRRDLLLLRSATQLEGAPARVEMRLGQELQTKREARLHRRSVFALLGALGAAALLVVAVGWARSHFRGSSEVPVAGPPAAVRGTPGSGASDSLLLADNDTGEFTQLPGNLTGSAEDSAILQVRMQRGALVRLGLPVSQEQASDWVNVDFLVGGDGLPQAVRLHQDGPAAASAE